MLVWPSTYVLMSFVSEKKKQLEKKKLKWEEEGEEAAPVQWCRTGSTWQISWKADEENEESID